MVYVVKHQKNILSQEQQHDS